MENKAKKSTELVYISFDQAKDIYKKLETYIKGELNGLHQQLMYEIANTLVNWLHEQDVVEFQNELPNESTNTVDLQVPEESAIQK